MSSIGAGSNQPISLPKTEAIEKKTMLDKGIDAVKEKTAKGTLVGDHYVAAGALTVVGGIAAVAGVAKLADNVPLVKSAVDVVVSKGTGGAINLAASVVLAEDAVQSLKEGKNIKGSAEALGAAVTGLGGVELVGRQFNIPYMDRAFTATGEFIGKNSQAIIGGASAIGGGVAIKSGIDDLKEDKKLKGGAKIAGGVVGIAGGTELIGRQFGIKYMDRALTGPIQAVFTSKGGLGVSGAVVAVTGAGTGVDGVRRLATGKGIVNDAVGTAELAAAVTGITGGTSLVGMAVGNETLKQVFPKNADVIGAVALGAGAVGLSKFTVNDMKEKGVTVINAATGTAAVMAGAGAVEVIGSKFGIPVAKAAFEKSWEPVLALGLGAASYKMGANAVKEVKDGKGGNALGQGAVAVVLGASSAALVGHAFKIPGLEQMGTKMLETTWKVAEPVVETAVKNPVATLVGVGVIGGVGAYTYYHNKNKAKEAEPPKAEAAAK